MTAVPAIGSQVRSLVCTKCGGSLALRSAAAKSIVCHYCGAQLDLTTPDYAFLETLRRPALVSPLRVGMRGLLAELPYEVVGLMRLTREGDDGYREDYLLLGPQGRAGWIRFDGHAYRLMHMVRPADAAPVEIGPFDPHSSYVEIDGEQHLVLERAWAVIDDLAGELLWKARVGERVSMLRCDGGLSVEVSPTQVRYLQWEPLPWQELAEGFELPEGAEPAPEPTLGPAPSAPRSPWSFDRIWDVMAERSGLILTVALIVLSLIVGVIYRDEGPKPLAPPKPSPAAWRIEK